MQQGQVIKTMAAPARQIAARNDERGMSDVAPFIGAAEENGDASLWSLASQMAEVVGEMHGLGIEGIAIELAYSPSELLSIAAMSSVESAASAASQNPKSGIRGRRSVTSTPTRGLTTCPEWRLIKAQ